MRCPECHSANEPGAPACTTCGLILLNAAPKRRSEDLASHHRRATDLDATHCPYCEGTIASRAVRCKHCTEVVNEEFYRERARRTRARVNYASWVAYIFGLAALLLFRPVGLLSIAAGLLLSIIYYMIPVEPPPSRRGGQKPKQSLGAFIKRQFKFERVAVPLPALRNKKLIFVGTPLIAALVGYSANLFLLQEPMDDILSHNASFNGMTVSTHYKYWIVPGVVVYDLRGIGMQTPIDVHTAFLEFAKKLRVKKYERVDLSWRGVTKFSINGDAFRALGEQYAKHNFDFVLYKLPRLVHPHVDSPNSDREALIEFHRHWYGDDAMTKSVR